MKLNVPALFLAHIVERLVPEGVQLGYGLGRGVRLAVDAEQGLSCTLYFVPPP